LSSEKQEEKYIFGFNLASIGFDRSQQLHFWICPP
jgi:hypothetical protein